MPTIRSIRAPLQLEIPKIRGSRFIAAVAPITERSAADAVVAGRRAAEPQATHHCFAYRLGRSENDFRFADDGEPSGTAGRPILKEIDGRGLTDVIAVVSRYFGGTKLGSGGLVRAYAAAAAAALDAAEIVERRVTTLLDVGFAYTHLGAVQGVLAAYDLEPIAADYGAGVRLQLAVPVEDVAVVRKALVDATAGRIEVAAGWRG